MMYQPFSTQGTSDAFEKAALARFCEMVAILPSECQIYREIWNQSTVLILDFKYCPNQLSEVKKQYLMLLLGADHLGLAQSVSFRLGHKLAGWMNLTATDF